MKCLLQVDVTVVVSLALLILLLQCIDAFDECMKWFCTVCLKAEISTASARNNLPTHGC